MVKNAIIEITECPHEDIIPSVSILELVADSLEFLDVRFEIERKFKIKLPYEQWSDDVEHGFHDFDYYFVISHLCWHIEQLLKEKDTPIRASNYVEWQQYR